MIHEFSNPLPVVTELGTGYAIYVRDGGTWENDIWCVVLDDGGHIKHFRSDQLRVHANATFDITPDIEFSSNKICGRYSKLFSKLAKDGIQNEFSSDGKENITRNEG